jgi:hypothetical protein
MVRNNQIIAFFDGFINYGFGTVEANYNSAAGKLGVATD